MSTHFNIFRSFTGYRIKKLSAIISGLMMASLCYGQYQPVQVTFSILPPYTPDIYKDYGQFSATLVSTEPVECYVIVSVEGEGGIRFFSEPSSKPPAPLILMPHIPYVINSANWQEAVNLDLMIFEGITQEELVLNGLPEGSYFFCLQVMDYMTGFPLSQEAPAGCASFIISSLSPPSFIECREFLSYPTPQFTNPVIWMTDPATPASAYYILTGKQVPFGMTAEQAWNLESVPPDFERTVKDKMYMLSGMDLGNISIGIQYVMAVQVIDPNNIFHIQNNGWSVPCEFIIGTGDSLLHKVETSETWPPGHILPDSPGWPPGGHKERVSKDWPPDHKDEISKTWPEGHLKEASKTWGDKHKEDLSKTWPANHEAGWSTSWPKGHTAEKSPTWPPNHHGDITKNWVNHDASRSPTWPANHTQRQSDTWGDHKKTTSDSWKANHDGNLSKDWVDRKHEIDNSKSWPANHKIDNSNGWIDNPNHNASKSPTWPPNHIVSQSKNYVNHTIDRSQQWSAGHKKDISDKWPDPKNHSQKRSLSWPADHKVERSTLYPRDHEIDRSQRWPKNHKVKTSENID